MAAGAEWDAVSASVYISPRTASGLRLALELVSDQIPRSIFHLC